MKQQELGHRNGREAGGDPADKTKTVDRTVEQDIGRRVSGHQFEGAFESGAGLNERMG